MGEKWQVVVSRWTEDDGWIEEAQLIAPREALARFAPGVVAEALGSTAEPRGEVATPLVVTSETMAGVVADSFGGQPAKRTRRTKAQIAADEAAALIEAQTAAEVAVTNGGNDPYPPEGETSTTAETAAPVTQIVTPTPGGAPAAPFNPFAPK